MSSSVRPVMTTTARTANCHGGTSCAATAGGRQSLAPLSLRADANHVPHEAAGLEAADHDRRRIDLPAAEPVPGGCRERVVVVVPRLTERGERQPEHVARLVGRR